MDIREATCFTAGIVKALGEGNHIARHFGSTAALDHHISVAQENGLIEKTDTGWQLTNAGVTYYYEVGLASLQDTRAYFWTGQRKFSLEVRDGA